MESELGPLLGALGSGEAGALGEAEARLQALSHAYPGPYHTALAALSLARESGLSDAARLQAALLLKNAVDSRWRVSSAALSDADKQSIRDTLLGVVHEPNNTIAAVTSVSMAKAARQDFPNQWQDLIPSLGQLLTSPPNSLQHRRTLALLSILLKSLASKRIGPATLKFRELVGQVWGPVLALWQSHLELVATDPASAYCAHYAAKCLAVMGLYGLADGAGAAQELGALLQSLPAAVTILIQTAGKLRQAKTEQAEFLEKAAGRLVKMMTELVDSNPEVLISRLPMLLQTTFDAYMSSDDISEKLQLRCLNFMKAVLLCRNFKSTSWDQNETEVGRFFTGSASLLASTLCRRSLGLGPAELETWESEPGALSEDDAAAWEAALRPASRAFFAALAHEAQESLIPVLRGWAEALLTPLSSQPSLPEILHRDAMMSGLGTVEEDDATGLLPMDSLLDHVLLAPSVWATQDPPSLRILRRRSLLLAGRWFGQLDKERQGRVYGLFSAALKEGDDVVVRLAASAGLRSALDDYAFKLTDFQPWLGPSVTGCIRLLGDLEEEEAQVRVMGTLLVMTDQTGSLVLEHMRPLFAALPQLWASDSNLLKSQILQLLRSIVQSGEVSMGGPICELLETAVDSSRPDHVYLLEDGLDLWLALLNHSPSEALQEEKLRQLYRHLPSLLRLQSENLRLVLAILSSYSLYPTFSQLLGWNAELDAAVMELLQELRPEGLVSVLRCLETVSGEGGAGLTPGVVERCGGLLCGADEATMSVQQRAGALVARAAVRGNLVPPVLSTPLIQNMLQVGALIRGSDALLKIYCLAFLHWMCSLETSCLELWPDLGAAVSEHSQLLLQPKGDGTWLEELLTVNSPDGEEGEETGEAVEGRKRLRRQTDPVYSMPLTQAVKESLKATQERMGGERFGALWASLDVEVQRHLQSLIT